VGDALSTRLLCELLLLVLRCFSSRWLPPVPERQDTQLASSCTRRAPPTSPTCWHPPSGTPSSSPTPRRGRSASSRPSDASHVQSAVLCGRGHGVRVRVRSGGHDYEGLSYRSVRPSEVLAVVDLGANLRAVRVNRFESTAWVDSGATIGELYYAIAKNDSRLAFPAGECATIGVGGHFSGGAIGMMMRKHGLSADKVLDATLVNADGDLLDRAGMGEDLFWAIRGGGGGNFGIVLSWKVQLVQVPPTHRQDGRRGRRGHPHQMAARGAVAPERPHHKGDRAGAAGAVPRRVRVAGGDDGRPVPGAAHDESRLPADDLAAVGGDALHQLRPQRHAGGGAPEQDSRPEQRREDQVRLRPARHPQGRVGGDLLLVHQGRRRVHDAGAARRVHGQRPRRGDAVPAPARRAVRHPVHRVLAAGRRRHGGDDLDRRPVRPHGAAREQEPEAGVRQLPGPGHRPERRHAGERRLAAVKAAVDPSDYLSNEQSIPPSR
uniref:FAD-binding PCMH-type domain-containing protein n=1 Tax=Aegilops tauschii subsp. strangulata TaxID=200361 RepID=A0A453JCQ7_AEGTS